MQAKDLDGNPFEIELDTTEFNISSTGEITTTKTYSSAQTITFSAVATDSYGSHAAVPITVKNNKNQIKINRHTVLDRLTSSCTFIR